MGSVIFTDDEARYIKAMLSWEEPTLDEKKQLDLARALEAEAEANKRQPVGEFRILVAGGKGTGKTSILTRVRDPIFSARSPLVHSAHPEESAHF